MDNNCWEFQKREKSVRFIHKMGRRKSTWSKTWPVALLVKQF